MTVLETARLRLEPWGEQHLGLLLELSALPEITRWVGDGRPWTPERAREVHANAVRRWEEHGCSWRAAFDRVAGEAVALVSANPAAEGLPGVGPGEHEIGWWTVPAHWGHGYATEAARAHRDDLFERVGAPAVIALIQPPNQASARVAAHLGMAVVGEVAGRAGELNHLHRVARG